MAIAESERPAEQPDISYTPDYEKYTRRTKRRLATENLETTLPRGFPQRLQSDLVWDGTDIASRFDWNYTLKQQDLDELESALQHFKSLSKPLGHVNQSTFPLPNLYRKLREISREIHTKFGFKVIRGVPVDKHTREEILIIYAGLASHIAPIRGRQDHLWNGKPADVVMAHIKDLSTRFDASQIGSPAYTTDKQVFHTDSGDVIALLCLEGAVEGGASKLSSSWRVYNHLAEQRPDLIHTLKDSWPTEKFSGKGGSFVNRPPLFYQEARGDSPERVIIQYARRYFTGYKGLPRSRNIPPITEAQAEALDALHFLAQKYAVTLEFQKGDIQFVNNLSIFHARDGFKDAPQQQRHLVRLWLRDDEYAWKLPEELNERWEVVYGGVKDSNQVFPLEPYIRSDAAGKDKAAQENKAICVRRVSGVGGTAPEKREMLPLGFESA